MGVCSGTRKDREINVKERVWPKEGEGTIVMEGAMVVTVHR